MGAWMMDLEGYEQANNLYIVLFYSVIHVLQWDDELWSLRC